MELDPILHWIELQKPVEGQTGAQLRDAARRVGAVEEFGPEHRRPEQPAQQQFLDRLDVLGRGLAEPERVQ